jgi:hypothetical protein
MVETLESRLQPGSILTGGIDMSALEGIVPQPSQPTQTLDRPIRRVGDVSETSIVSTSTAPSGSTGQTSDTQATATATSSLGLDQPEIQTVVTQQSSGLQPKKTETTVIPALHAPGSRAVSPNAPVAHKSGIQVQTPMAVADAGDVKVKPVSILQADGPSTSQFQLKAEPVACEGVGGRANFFNSYMGGAGADGHNAVAAAKGPIAGDSFSAGYEVVAGVSVGRITRYTAAGACVAAINITAGGGVVEIKDVGANNDAAFINNVYITGNAVIGGVVNGFVGKLGAALTGFTAAPALFPAPAGGAISFDGLGLQPIESPPGAPNVYISGYTNDPAVGAQDLWRVMAFGAGLGVPIYNLNYNFGAGASARGRAVDANRMGQSFHGGSLVSGGIQSPTRMGLDPAGVTLAGWGGAIINPSAVTDVRNGWNGVDVTTGPPGAMYLTGTTVTATSVNQGLRKASLVTGATIWGFAYTIGAGTELIGEDIVATRGGVPHTAGHQLSAGDRLARWDRWTTLGAPSAVDGLGSGGGTDDRGMGVDLNPNVSGLDPQNVYMSGITDSAEGVMLPAPVGCDITFGGITDGFAAYGSQAAPGPF